MKLSRFLPLCAAFLIGPLPVVAATITPEEAPAHAGETATICGTVESSHFAPRSRGQPTFLDFDRPYPNETFTALIWGSERPKFGEPEKTMQGTRVCVTGKIELYRGRPELILRDPEQLKQ
jgi:hypothetical protein